ncbi:MAG: hypothetical protein HDR85_10750 [Bacteroides sp.]|nr:hypothetical protein [Bacteroides sp.]
MLGALISFLLVYAIYAFIDWLRNSKKPFKLTVLPHKKIARTVWIYCVFLISVAIIMVNFSDFNRHRFYRPMYGQYEGLYFPYGHYSDLNIGDIRDKFEFNGRHIRHSAILLGHYWEELSNDDSNSHYKRILKTFHTYDSERNSKTFGRGMILRVYDLDNEITDLPFNEKLVYENIIDSFVSDSSFYKLSQNFDPYPAIETATYATLSMDNDSLPLFKKHITIFANNRAYELNFYVDKKIGPIADSNPFDFLDAEFIKVAKRLNLHSYKEWQRQESEYNSNLNIKCVIFIVLYIFCILGALSFAFRYYRNIGTINPKAAKITVVLSIFNFVTFVILGIGFIAAFCFIHHEYIHEMYQYRFAAYINDENAATSVLCYGAYFLLLIIPTNRFYIKSYTQPKTKEANSKTNHSLIYWLVRPFVLMSKFLSKSTKIIRDEYNNQISANN